MKFEIEQARTELQSIKEKIEDYLKRSYSDEETAIDTYKYLEGLVDDICKRKKVNIQFSSGADPGWHADVYKMFSKWIQLEDDLAMMLSRELDTF